MVMHSSTMNKNDYIGEQAMGIPINLSVSHPVNKAPKGYLTDAAAASRFRDPSSENKPKKEKGDSMFIRLSDSGKGTDSFANVVRDHEKLGAKISETVKRKLSLGARILQEGGINKIFKQFFSVKEGEKLLKACQCYLSTTAGPIAGILFISAHKVAFCSERSIKITSPNGELIRVHYKVLIPLSKIKRVYQSENMKKASQKYIEMVTVDGFDFWFMGFLNYQKAFKYLQLALSLCLDDHVQKYTF